MATKAKILAILLIICILTVSWGGSVSAHPNHGGPAPIGIVLKTAPGPNIYIDDYGGTTFVAISEKGFTVFNRTGYTAYDRYGHLTEWIRTTDCWDHFERDQH